MTDTSKPARLLVIDDNKVNRIVLSRNLEQQGHTVETAENGKEGLEKLRSGSFDLVLLDIEMPVMDGFQVLEECLNDVELRQLPIIMTSAMDEIDAVVKCVELGAEDYLTKPVNPVLLRARVNASLEKKFLRDEQRKLFRTFATKEVAEELLRSGFSLVGKEVTATVMFADIRSFTTITESRSPGDTFDLLNDYFALMFDAINNNFGMVNQLVGDGLMAVFGAPLYNEDHSENAVRAALKMMELLAVFNQRQAEKSGVQITIGIGIATGKMSAGFIGTQNRATYTCIGDAVNLASRIEQHTKVALKPILVDENTRRALPQDIPIESVGSVLLKGKTHETNIFSVTLPA